MLHAERRRQEALRALRRALGSKRRAKLFSAWQLCLDETAGPEDGDAARPIEDVARERIERRLERFLKRGRALAGGAAPGKVHKLRIQAKKLRYLIDAFGGAFAPEAAAEVVGRLKKLQDALGTFNDREVEIRLLERFGGELLSAGAVPAATLLAMGRRQADLERDMKRLRRRFRGGASSALPRKRPSPSCSPADGARR
jgi:CHAD domain-containing protein